MALRNARKEGQEGTPRLILRFGIYAGLAMLAAAVAAYFFVRHYATTGAEASTQDHAGYVARAVLPTELTAADFAAPASGGRLHRLDWIADKQLLRAGVVRVKLYDPAGRVVYSSDHELIGTRPDDVEEVVDAFHGTPVSDVTTLDAEGGHAPDRKILESYVPVRLDGRPVGVLEFYSDYQVVASDARGIFVPVAIGIGVLLLALYISFFPILRRATRTMRDQFREIRHKAYHDDLTGLPNRALFLERVEEAVARSAERRLSAVLLLDLERFRDVNDTLGHSSGDRLLRSLAVDLTAALRPTDTVARLGSDDFGILALDIKDPTAVLALAEKLRDALGKPRTLDGVELELDAAVGIALHPEHGEDALTLLRHADVALHRSEQLKAPVLYESGEDPHSPERLGLLAELRRGLGEHEVVVHYQPQHDPASGRMLGVEALVRWQHPQRGLLTPDQFIPMAERTALIRCLTRYVIDAALGEARRWRDEGIDLAVAVNLSANDLLDQSLPADVEALLERHGVEPRLLELEVTENAAIVDLPGARELLTRLHRTGIRLAIDDFGTGNSSLAYFRRLPFDVVKVDRSFVMRMDECEDDAAIVRATISLAHDLGLKVVAEGVETAAANERLAGWHCDAVQGFLYSTAVPAEEITAAVRA